MSRRLMLLRHAKSDWSSAWLDDHDRPLAERGLRDAPLMGRWMRRQGLIPDKVLCSTATRARQTWELASQAFSPPPPVAHVEMLYAFSSIRPLLLAARRFGADARTLLLVGHNEAMHELACALARRGEARALKRLHKKFPTAALAVIDLPIDAWEELSDFTAGTLAHYVKPKDLR